MYLFTSHYVSINSITMQFLIMTLLYLHPTMYLLIPDALSVLFPVYLNLHPTMYLLIPSPIASPTVDISSFTSHYVSINSEQSQDELFTSKIFTSHYVSINSA